MKMEKINKEIRLFIHDITLFLQRHENYTPEKIEPIFQRSYNLYLKYDVEQTRNKPVGDGCDCGGKWRGDGVHQNEFCDTCFKTKPDELN